MDDDTKISKPEFIPDFFREFISRIIPGMVFIGIYIFWSGKHLKVVFSDATLSVFVLVAAWIIGVTIDVGA